MLGVCSNLIFWRTSLEALVLFAAARVRKGSNEEKKNREKSGDLPSLLKDNIHLLVSTSWYCFHTKTETAGNKNRGAEVNGHTDVLKRIHESKSLFLPT